MPMKEIQHVVFS